MSAEDLDWMEIVDEEKNVYLFLEKYDLIIPYDQPFVRRRFGELSDDEKSRIKDIFKYFYNLKVGVNSPLQSDHAAEVLDFLLSGKIPQFSMLEPCNFFLVCNLSKLQLDEPFAQFSFVYDRNSRGTQACYSISRIYWPKPTTCLAESHYLAESHFLLVKYFEHCSRHELYIKELRAKGYDILRDSAEIKNQNKNLQSDNSNEEVKKLLECDYRRCGLKSYETSLLTDVKQGHWDLFENGGQSNYYARDPSQDVKSNGVIGIDFGTRSTVVVKQQGTNVVDPLRIGSLDLSTSVSDSDFENPTIVSCMNIDNFLDAYLSKTGRPETSCEDFFVSYTAYKDYISSPPEFFYSFFADLKQWANSEKRSAVVQDKKNEIYSLDEECSVEKHVLNPIELYAYYIGMYINNMRSGIFLRYIMSFPVKFSKSTKELIRSSFERGIKKSLPVSIIQNQELMNKFSVKYELSEPAAYAVTALMLSELKPESENEKYLYGVFDFGGGTADFDFGVWRGASDSEYDRNNCDYVLECFGADSDPNLGGENILGMLAYHIFKDNREMAEKNRIPMALPSGEKPFIGSETLVNESKEAYRNLTLLKEALRPLWEQQDGWEQKYKSESSENSGTDSISVQLVNSSGEQTPNCCFKFDAAELINIIKDRIRKGVDSFFNCLEKVVCGNTAAKKASEDIHIFLAGNSCRSAFVEEIFNQKISDLEKVYSSIGCDINGVGGSSNSEDCLVGRIFKLVKPLSGVNEDSHSPNAKTGVAFGLVYSRKGSKIYVIKNDENDAEIESRFKYYLGTERRGKFECKLKPVVYEDGEPKSVYGRWIKFQGAGMGVARIYFTEDPAADSEGGNKIPIDDISFVELEFDANEDDYLFVKAVSPNEIEYAVAESEEYIRDSERKCIC